jgi:hypothetical protein
MNEPTARTEPEPELPTSPDLAPEPELPPPRCSRPCRLPRWPPDFSIHSSSSCPSWRRSCPGSAHRSRPRPRSGWVGAALPAPSSGSRPSVCSRCRVRRRRGAGVRAAGSPVLWCYAPRREPRAWSRGAPARCLRDKEDAPRQALS